MSEDKIEESLLETDSDSDDRDFMSGASSSSEDDMEEGEDGNGDNEGMELEGAVGFVAGEDDDEDDEEDEGMGAEAPEKKKTYIPGMEDEAATELDFDETAYVMYHKAECGYPCLSFDVIPDALGSSDERASQYPQTVYLVAGTQAPKVHANKLLVMKMTNLTRMKAKPAKDSDDEDDEDEEENGEDDPRLLTAQIPHNGAVNRVRATTLGHTQVAASWSENGHVNVWDLTKQLQAVEDQKTNDLFNKLKNHPKPIFSFRGHGSEGYGMDWSQVNKGFFATGDQNSKVFIWKPLEAFSWNVNKKPLEGHTDSVEDIQWSPNEGDILASCSVDKSIRVWDIRSPDGKALVIPDAHESDVNVISWNKKETCILLSGGDDGTIKTWDMRQLGKTCTPIALLKHHSGPITSVEWHPSDNSVFAASGDDNQITLWDVSVEKDEEEEGVGSGSSNKDDDDEEDKARLDKLPPQLLFIHQGVNEVKELHWHPQVPGLVISTALSGFDIFRTISV